MEAYATTQVNDPLLRSILISACQNLEIGISSGKITQTTEICTRTPMGLLVKVEFHQKKDRAAPIIFMFRYSWDMAALKRWAANHTDLLEGPLLVTQKGIEVCLIPEKTRPSFTIENGSERIALALDQTQEVFKVHREISRGTEWVVALEQ